MTTPTSGGSADPKVRVKRQLARRFAADPAALKAVQEAIRNTGATAATIASATASHLGNFVAQGITPGKASDAPTGRARSNAISAGSDAGAPAADLSGEITQLQFLIDATNVKAEVCDSLQEAVGALSGYEFMQQSPSALATLVKVKLALSGMAKDMRSAAERANAAKSELAGVNASDQAAVTKALTRFRSDNEKIQKALRDAAKTANDVVGSAQGRVEEQALYNYFKAHPSEARKALAAAESLTSIGLSVGSEFIPPGWKWTGAVASVIVKVAYRAAEEGMTASEKSKYVDSVLSPGEIFAQFDQDPTIMARGLAETLKSNVKLLMAGISAACNEVPFWSVVSATVEAVIREVIDARVERAAAQIAGCKTKAEAEGAYSSLQGVAEVVGEQLFDKLKDPDTWGGSTKLIKSIAESGEKVADNANELAAALATAVVGPITKRVLKAFPPSPAQLVSGSELVDALNGIQRAGVPAQFRGTDGMGTRTRAAAGDRQTIGDDELPTNTPNGAPIADSDLRKTIDGPSGKAFYVAFDCGGVKVWGFLNSTGVWLPDRVDDDAISDSANVWKARRPTRTGYTERMSAPVTGTWYKPFANQAAFVLVRADGRLEVAGGAQATEAGGDFKNTVGGMVGSVAQTGSGIFTPGT